MRIGIVGTGTMGRVHAAAWAQTPAQISGFLSKPAVMAEEIAGQYNSSVYEKYLDLLADVDVVDICLPTHLHHRFVLEAAEAGKHIICEKPLARTVEQAEEMIAACDAAGVILLVAHVVRFFPEYALAKEKIASGEIGKPAVLNLKRGTFHPKKAEDNWFADFEKSGGMMLDLMIHDFDYARWVAGEVERVYAQKISSNQATASVDHGLVILTHRDGALSHIEGSWAYPAPLFRTRLEIAASNGWLRHDSESMAALTIHLHKTDSETPDVPAPSSPLDEDPYVTEIKSFYEHLIGSTQTRVSAHDGLAALQIGLAAIESAETGKPVDLKELQR